MTYSAGSEASEGDAAGDCPALHYEVHAGDGPHVLLVHGMWSARSHWLPNLSALQQYARPVVVELYGHGRSPTPEAPACYHPDAYVAQFELIREAVGAERWFVVGQSLGAALTVRYAFSHPGQVIAQALTNSASAFAPAGFQERLEKMREARQRQIAESGAPIPADSPMSPARNRRVSPQVRRALEEDVALHSALGVAYGQMHTLPYTSNRDRVEANVVPALLLVGEREQRFDADRRFLEEHMANLEVVGLEAGHGVNLDAPEAFNAALRAFFTRFVE